MNNNDREDLKVLKIEVKNNTGQLEKIVKNDLPHLLEKVSENTGKLKVLIPLIILCIAGVGGLYLLIINLLGG